MGAYHFNIVSKIFKVGGFQTRFFKKENITQEYFLRLQLKGSLLVSAATTHLLHKALNERRCPSVPVMNAICAIKIINL